MNREIKFRAWLPEFKRMETGLFGLRSDGLASFNSDAILLQYTGLKDKNGKEIYEGDMTQERYVDGVEDSGFGVVAVVAFKDGAFGWIGEITGRFYSFADVPLDTYEVIGNVYENPELLSRKQKVQVCDTTDSQSKDESQ
jgi:hypothetical protein